MPYQPDANEVARRQATREQREGAESGIRPVLGTLSYWTDVTLSAIGRDPTMQSPGVHIDIKANGMIIAYDENGDAEIFVPAPGAYLNFVPDRESE